MQLLPAGIELSIEDTFEAVNVVDLNGQIIFASPSVYDVFGLPQDYQPVGESLLRWVHPDDRRIALARMQEFAAGEITKTVTVTILDDSEAEPDESILLTLSGPSAGAVILDQGKALLTIVDNDEALHTDFLNLPAVARQ